MIFEWRACGDAYPLLLTGHIGQYTPSPGDTSLQGSNDMLLETIIYGKVDLISLLARRSCVALYFKVVRIYQGCYQGLKLMYQVGNKILALMCKR